MIGEEAINQLYTIAIQFVFGNRFQLPENDDYNVTDEYIKHLGDGLSPEDLDLLIAVRDSYMSVYEV